MNEKSNLYLKKGLRLAGLAVLGICAAVFFALFFAIAVKLLWNWLMPEIFGLIKITFAQAVGLVVLARLLVGGWHRGHRDKNHRTGVYEHLNSFSDPEREKIPGEIRKNREVFNKFWNEYGKKSFDKYVNESKTD